MTLAIGKVWGCDYRECDATYEQKKTGRRGEHVAIFGEIPRETDWVKINFQSSGRNEVLHFCCQDCMEKELNLLTQQGLEAQKHVTPPALGSGNV